MVSSETWKRVFYLFLKFPFGNIGFVFLHLVVNDPRCAENSHTTGLDTQ